MLKFVALAFAIGVAVGAIPAVRYTSQIYEAKIKAARAAEIIADAQRKADADEAMESVVTYYETRRKTSRVRHETIRVEVEKIVDRPVYSDCRLDDDGVRLFNASAADVLRPVDPAAIPGAMPGTNDATPERGDDGRPIARIRRPGAGVP